MNNFCQIDVSEFSQAIDQGDIIIDVRTPEEIPMYGKISEQQLLININDVAFSTEIEKLDKTKKYALYCWHGSRSQVARNYMESVGFQSVVDLK